MPAIRRGFVRFIALLAWALAAAADARDGTADAETRLLHSLQSTFDLAAHTGKRAVLCPSRDGRECATSPDWSRGWIAFLDEDGNREHAPFEPLILAEAALPGDVRLRSTLGRTRLVFHGGDRRARSSLSFTLCDARGARHARALILSDGGGLRHGVPAEASVAATCVH